jgi:glycosyltransferase involved in cell wall biosynthesis
MKYSVIIPVYNSEKTIKRCIESITLQNRADVEIIIINDGSTDKTESICKALQTAHENIIYITKENGGVSSARNSGLSVATGEYVMFVDSDDYVDSKCFDTIDKYIKSNADFYQFGFSIVANGLVKEIREFSECKINTPSEKETFLSDGVVTRSINSPWAKIYKRKIIDAENLRFPQELSVGEDLTFVFSFLLSTEKIERLTDKIYFADIGNAESLSRKYREDLSEQLIGVYDGMVKALQKSKTKSKQLDRSLAWLFYRNAYSVINDLTKSSLTFLERRKKLKAMCSLFNSKKVAPIGVKCKLIAIPIKLKLIGLTDVVFQVINKLK